jgi:hypothetical protein
MEYWDYPPYVSVAEKKAKGGTGIKNIIVKNNLT